MFLCIYGNRLCPIYLVSKPANTKTSEGSNYFKAWIGIQKNNYEIGKLILPSCKKYVFLSKLSKYFRNFIIFLGHSIKLNNNNLWNKFELNLYWTISILFYNLLSLFSYHYRNIFLHNIYYLWNSFSSFNICMLDRISCLSITPSPIMCLQKKSRIKSSNS